MKTHVVVGLEMHCEMLGNSKVFSPASNVYNKEPNRNINEIDLGFPGIMPCLNIGAFKRALKASLILNCEVPEYLVFDRKNFYYPDLPKGYQITQFTYPIGTKGCINVEVDGHVVPVTIGDIHLEEDTASMDHLETISLLDYNRAGVPLLECVTDPCMHSADEAVAFLETMCRMYQYADISDADSKKGQIRCDVNVNLQDENGNYVTPRVEIKNVNSLSNVKATILYEEKRQREALEKGEKLEQETRRFDEESGTTIHMRSKEDAIDYKYFIEPNIPPFKIDEDLIQEVKEEIPMLADERKKMYIEKYNLDVESARIIVRNKAIADYFEDCLNIGIDSKMAANWLNGMIISYLNKEDILIKDFYLKPEYLKQIIDKVLDNTISSKQAKEIFNKALQEHKEPKNFISSDNKQITDRSEIEAIVDKVLAQNEEQIKDYQNGHTNLFDYFVGQVMKETKGKASPVITKELIHNKIDKN